MFYDLGSMDFVEHKGVVHKRVERAKTESIQHGVEALVTIKKLMMRFIHFMHIKGDRRSKCPTPTMRMNTASTQNHQGICKQQKNRGPCSSLAAQQHRTPPLLCLRVLVLHQLHSQLELQARDLSSSN